MLRAHFSRSQSESKNSCIRIEKRKKNHSGVCTKERKSIWGGGRKMKIERDTEMESLRMLKSVGKFYF
jgi:hypothetical protein